MLEERKNSLLKMAKLINANKITINDRSKELESSLYNSSKVKKKQTPPANMQVLLDGMPEGSQEAFQNGIKNANTQNEGPVNNDINASKVKNRTENESQEVEMITNYKSPKEEYSDFSAETEGKLPVEKIKEVLITATINAQEIKVSQPKDFTNSYAEDFSSKKSSPDAEIEGEQEQDNEETEQKTRLDGLMLNKPVFVHPKKHQGDYVPDFFDPEELSEEEKQLNQEKLELEQKLEQEQQLELEQKLEQEQQLELEQKEEQEQQLELEQKLEQEQQLELEQKEEQEKSEREEQWKEIVKNIAGKFGILLTKTPIITEENTTVNIEHTKKSQTKLTRQGQRRQAEANEGGSYEDRQPIPADYETYYEYQKDQYNQTKITIQIDGLYPKDMQKIKAEFEKYFQTQYNKIGSQTNFLEAGGNDKIELKFAVHKGETTKALNQQIKNCQEEYLKNIPSFDTQLNSLKKISDNPNQCLHFKNTTKIFKNVIKTNPDRKEELLNQKLELAKNNYTTLKTNPDIHLEFLKEARVYYKNTAREVVNNTPDVNREDKLASVSKAYKEDTKKEFNLESQSVVNKAERAVKEATESFVKKLLKKRTAKALEKDNELRRGV
jgi:hypothetical protein